MLQRLEDGPSETSVRFRKRVGMILCFGASAYLLAVSFGLLRHAGSLADLVRDMTRPRRDDGEE